MSPTKWILVLAMPFLTVALSIGAAQVLKGIGQDNLPVLQRVSKPVKQYDLDFEIIADSIWAMPSRTGKSDPASQLPTGVSPVRFQLRVTNHSKKEVRFLSGAGMPILQSADGKELKAQCLGNNHLRRLIYLTLEAGKTVTVKGSANLHTGRDGTCLWWEDEYGANWRIDGLKPGKYSLKLQYNSRRGSAENSAVAKSGAWLGDVRTAEVPIEIVDLKASEPVVVGGIEAMSRDDGTWRLQKAAELGWKDDVEARALTESTWQMPATGKQTQVSLGFRMATVEKWWVRIIPGIAAVSIKSADGVDLPVRKTAAKVSVPEPQLLSLRPEYSNTVATPATLFNDGKTRTLAWADGAGQVWHVENLKPGRYEVRYLIRAEKGEPSRYISYWVGKIRTEAVMVEIKE